ncbi:KSR2 Kinase, partial [Copsychus sechellarum]|nr:KSR2 Kinase [Copsychus sechellarum]
QSKLVKYFSRQLSCKRKVALQERNAKLEGFPQLLHWFRIVDIRKEVMEEIAPGQLSLEDLLDMTDDQVCATVEKFGANSEECARLNASLSCLRSVHKSGGSLSKQDWTIQWPSTEPGKENSPGLSPEPGPWGRTHPSPKVQPRCGQHHCHSGSPHGPAYTHGDRLTVEGPPGLCPPPEPGHRSLPPSPRQRHAAHTPPRTPNIVTTMTPPGTPPVRRRNKLKPPGTPPPSSRKLIHLIPGFTALHRSKSHEFQLGHRVDEAHTPKWERQGGPSGCRTQKLWKMVQKAPPGLGMYQSLSQHVCPPLGCPAAPGKVLPGGNGSASLLEMRPRAPRTELATGEEISAMLKHSWLSWWPCSVHDLCWSSWKVEGPKIPGFMSWWCWKEGQDGFSRGTRQIFVLHCGASILTSFQPWRRREMRWRLPGGIHPQQQTLPKAGKPPAISHPWCPCVPGELAVLWSAWDSGRILEWHEEDSGGSPEHSQKCCDPSRGEQGWISGISPQFSPCFIVPHALCPPQNEEGAEEVQESEDDFEEMNLSLLSARNFPRKASQTSIFLQEWDIPFEQLEIGELIGKGRFGQVFHGRWHGEVAIRLIDIERDNEDQLKAFKREVMAYRQTRHENVVLFMGACMSPPHLAIITSLCKGRTLYSVVRDAKIVLDVNKTRQIAQEIVKGMGYLHAKGILHKDLKSKNVFYDNGKVVITDFGLFSISGVLQAGRRENKLRIQNGWLCHLAPEIIRQLSPDTEEDKLPFSKHSDVFALGTIWYELHAREWPFKTQPAEAIIWQVGRGMKPNLSQIGMGKEISDILLFCWAYEQEERPTFTKLMDMLEKLPKRNRRLSHPGHFWKSAE